MDTIIMGESARSTNLHRLSLKSGEADAMAAKRLRPRTVRRNSLMMSTTAMVTQKKKYPFLTSVCFMARTTGLFMLRHMTIAWLESELGPRFRLPPPTTRQMAPRSGVEPTKHPHSLTRECRRSSTMSCIKGLLHQSESSLGKCCSRSVQTLSPVAAH